MGIDLWGDAHMTDRDIGIDLWGAVDRMDSGIESISGVMSIGRTVTSKTISGALST